MKALVTKTISFYQAFASPLIRQVFGSVCRFNPTCSEYTKQQVQKYGIIKGIRLGIKQLSGCHPWAKNS